MNQWRPAVWRVEGTLNSIWGRWASDKRMGGIPPLGVFVADRDPVDNTCSVECCSGGWSGYAGSAVVMVLLRSHPHCGPWSTGNHTTDSYNWSQLLLNHCCLGLLGWCWRGWMADLCGLLIPFGLSLLHLSFLLFLALCPSHQD